MLADRLWMPLLSPASETAKLEATEATIASGETLTIRPEASPVTTELAAARLPDARESCEVQPVARCNRHA